MNFCDYGIGPLYLACENHSEQLAEMLLEKGAAPNRPTNNGKYPLVLASYSGYEKLVALLLKYGADPNLEGREGLSLYLASKHGHESVIKLLLANGALVNKPDKDGETAIFASVNAGHTMFTKLLLEHKADPLQPRKDGDTAMDMAVKKRDWAAVVMMLMYVEAPHARNCAILKRNKAALIKAANEMQEQKVMASAENKKVLHLIEEISTKKISTLKTVKNPEHSKREDELPQSECKTINEDMNRFFAHSANVRFEEQLVVGDGDTSSFVAT
jgi:ankyrin repeat protein